MIETTVGEIVETYGLETRKNDSGEVVLRTALHAVKSLKFLPPRLRRDLAFLDHELEPEVRAYEEIRKREYDDITEIAKDADGNPVYQPDERGVMKPVYQIPREKLLVVEKRLADYLKEKRTVKVDVIKWPNIINRDIKEYVEHVLPSVDDMARTMTFIDYSEVE